MLIDRIIDFSDGGDIASQGLAGVIITGIVTITVTLIGVFTTRARNREPQHSQNSQPPIPNLPTQGTHEDWLQAEVADLRRQRNTLQRKYDTSEAEVDRLQRLCWLNHVDPTPPRVEPKEESHG